MITEKKCGGACQKVLPRSEFYTNGMSLAFQCKTCQKAYAVVQSKLRAERLKARKLAGPNACPHCGHVKDGPE